MKVRIRGLVFAGFAAAVFAQSAMAGITPPSEQDPAHPDALKKTVVSQDYTDETYQERLKGLTDSNMYLTEDPEKGVTEEAAFIGWNYGQGGIDREWVKLRGKKQIDNTDEYIRIKHDTTNGADNHYVEFNDAAIADIANEITQAGGNNATDLQQARLTTAKAVYDFVNEELDEMGADIRGNVNYHTEKVAWLDDGFASTNQITNPVTQAQLNLPANAEWKNHIDHWELIVPNARVAGTAQNIIDGGTSNQTDVQTNLTTAKAVYDFVTDPNTGFQRKITPSEATSLAGFGTGNDAGEGVMIGHRATTGANTDSEWYVFGAKANGVDQTNSANNHLSYLYLAEDTSESRKKFLISIKDGVLAESGSAIITGGTASGENAYLTRDKLTTAKAVYELLDVETSDGTTTISSSSTNTKVPTSKNVFDFVQSMMGGQNLPTMPGTCIAEGVHCALVSSYHAADAAHNNQPYAVLEWTIMAQAQ